MLDALEAARALFEFAAAAWPPRPVPGLALGAWADGRRLVGAVVTERAGAAALLHGPVVVGSPLVGSADSREPVPPATEADPLEVAVQLVSAALDHVTASGIETTFARPQGLDRVWVRFGFIPVPEVALPEALRGRPGAGLFAYHGGSALWSLRPGRAEQDAARDLFGPRLAAGSPPLADAAPLETQRDSTRASPRGGLGPVRRRRSARKSI